MGKNKRFLSKKPLPEQGKLAHVGSSGKANRNTLKPAFNLGHIPDKGKGSLTACEQQEQASLAKRLARLSQMSWSEIATSGKHQMGYETIEPKTLKIGKAKLSRALQDERGAISEDVRLMVFRFSSKKGRMIGYRKEQVFYICWLDRNHDLF